MISRILKINVKALVRANRAKPDLISNVSECDITDVFGGVLLYRVSNCENKLHVNFTSPFHPPAQPSLNNTFFFNSSATSNNEMFKKMLLRYTTNIFHF